MLLREKQILCLLPKRAWKKCPSATWMISSFFFSILGNFQPKNKKKQDVLNKLFSSHIIRTDWQRQELCFFLSQDKIDIKFRQRSANFHQKELLKILLSKISMERLNPMQTIIYLLLCFETMIRDDLKFIFDCRRKVRRFKGR